MKPPHDMGGNPAEPVIPDKPDEPKFDEAWHRRVLGITIAVGAMGGWSIDASRYARESLPRSDYKKFSYYEKWLGGLTNLLFQRGFISKNEIQSGHGESKSPLEWRENFERQACKCVSCSWSANAPSRGKTNFFSESKSFCQIAVGYSVCADWTHAFAPLHFWQNRSHYQVPRGSCIAQYQRTFFRRASREFICS